MVDLGYYANLFEVLVPYVSIEVMTIERSNYPTLRDLRDEIKRVGKDVFVYAPERSEKIYGYGLDKAWLSSKSFKQEIINLHDEPRLAGWMVLQAVINKAGEYGYSPIFGKDKGRCRLFNWNGFKPTFNNQVKVFMGFDVRVIFLKELLEDRLNFGLIVDMSYSLKDVNDQSLSFHNITSRFGSTTLKEVRQIQRDLIPTGINKEVSRQRLVDDIIPFVEKIQKIKLPCGLEADVSFNPSRIILGGGNEPVW